MTKASTSTATSAEAAEEAGEAAPAPLGGRWRGGGAGSRRGRPVGTASAAAVRRWPSVVGSRWPSPRSSPLTSAARSSNSVASASGSSTAHVLSLGAVVPGRLEVELGVGVGRFGAVDDVDDDDGDVVPPALAVGQRDELVGRGLRVGDGVRTSSDLVVADLVDEAVAAQEEAVAAHERQRPGVDADRRVDAERPG